MREFPLPLREMASFHLFSVDRSDTIMGLVELPFGRFSNAEP